MYIPEALIENETPKILWDFETQIEHQIAWRLDLVLINKKKELIIKSILPFVLTI